MLTDLLGCALFSGTVASSLTLLDISDNQFSSLPACIHSLSSLTVLIARGNQLAVFSPIQVGGAVPSTVPTFLYTLQVRTVVGKQFLIYSSSLP